MSSIGSIGSTSNYASSMMSGPGRMSRPDPAKMAEQLFSKLDTKGQGYIEKSDLQSAFDRMSVSSSSQDASVDEVFSQLDGDGDGKLTQTELSSRLSELASQLDEQFNQRRMGGMGAMSGAEGGGMRPPPPPPPSDDAGLTEDELTSRLESINSSGSSGESRQAELMGKVLENFEAADTDADGKVSFQEAMAYDQSTRNSSASDNASNSGSVSNGRSEQAVMRQIISLMHAYGDTSASGQSSSLSSLLSVSA